MKKVTVKAIREHNNAHGKTWKKKKGDTYEVTEREAKNLAQAKLVEVTNGSSSK
ncbi:hypothetical protein K3172_12940 [Qipengyuania sp. 6B39]|uniref:hypothetical protein n=1 Tax=Qipengyuania proteolytica TaxID=2867239 RepID=UPI001C89E0BF|nr:hypothetical protein [Qipengyuania proteolytica]MBX7496765.1 hypothetical protein [Qipengyuania proteolytica]